MPREKTTKQISLLSTEPGRALARAPGGSSNWPWTRAGCNTRSAPSWDKTHRLQATQIQEAVLGAVRLDCGKGAQVVEHCDRANWVNRLLVGVEP